MSCEMGVRHEDTVALGKGKVTKVPLQRGELGGIKDGRAGLGAAGGGPGVLILCIICRDAYVSLSNIPS